MSPRDTGLPSPRTRVGGHTPGFDGVLGGGDSWVARRRASEASLKAGVVSRESSGDHDGKTLEIPEEAEEEVLNGSGQTKHIPDGSAQNQPLATSGTDPAASNGALPKGSTVPGTGNLDSSMKHLSMNPNDSFVPDGNAAAANGPPPGLVDYASVEWSYKDPSGQVQGVFSEQVVEFLTALTLSLPPQVPSVLT